ANLDVQVAGGATAGTDLALAGQPQPHAVLDTGRHLHRDRALRAHPAFASAVRAWVTDPGADAAALGAAPGGDDLAEERTLHRLHFTAAFTGAARLRVRPRSGAGPMAAR